MQSSKGLVGLGAQTPVAHATGVPLGAQARTFVVQLAGTTSDTTIDWVHEPPVATDEKLTATLPPAVPVTHSVGVLTSVHDAVTGAVAQGARLPHVGVPKTLTVVSQDTPVAPPHVHLEHVAAGATSPEPPATSSVVAEGHEDAAVAPLSTTTGPVQPDGAGAAQTSEAVQVGALEDEEALLAEAEELVDADELVDPDVPVDPEEADEPVDPEEPPEPEDPVDADDAVEPVDAEEPLEPEEPVAPEEPCVVAPDPDAPCTEPPLLEEPVDECSLSLPLDVEAPLSSAPVMATTALPQPVARKKEETSPDQASEDRTCMSTSGPRGPSNPTRGFCNRCALARRRRSIWAKRHGLADPASPPRAGQGRPRRERQPSVASFAPSCGPGRVRGTGGSPSAHGTGVHGGAHTGSDAVMVPASPVSFAVRFVAVPPVAGITYTSAFDP